MAIKIRHESNERENLAFERCFPAIGVGAVNRREISVVVGIAEENVSAGGNLSASQARGQEQTGDNHYNFSHDN
jgi:hypothetical protein